MGIKERTKEIGQGRDLYLNFALFSIINQAKLWQFCGNSVAIHY